MSASNTCLPNTEVAALALRHSKDPTFHPFFSLTFNTKLFSKRCKRFTHSFIQRNKRILLMEGLISASIKLNPPRSLCSRQHNSLNVPLLAPRFTKRVLIRATGEMRSQKSLNSVTASVQPLETLRAGSFNNTLPSKEVLGVWKNVNAVCFDVDSTVCLDEGIDELAEFCGAGEAVAKWTARAMGGSVPFEKALAARLSLFNPSLSQLQEFLDTRPPRLSPGIDVLVKKLQDKNKTVYLVSGGFRQMIYPVAAALGIPLENIYANQLLFESSGEFSGFDPYEPTSRSGGKAVAVQQIRKVKGYKSLVMIGDGATDLEARKPGGADLFVCYAGVVLRESVAAKADWVVSNFDDLINSLD